MKRAYRILRDGFCIPYADTPVIMKSLADGAGQLHAQLLEVVCRPSIERVYGAGEALQEIVYLLNGLIFLINREGEHDDR